MSSLPNSLRRTQNLTSPVSDMRVSNLQSENCTLDFDIYLKNVSGSQESAQETPWSLGIFQNISLFS